MHSDLNFIVPVLLLELSPPAVVALGYNHSFTCRARGRPLPTLLWLPEQTPPHITIVTDSLETDIVTSVLMLHFVSLNDSGGYSCAVSNMPYGNDTTHEDMNSTFLYVLGKETCIFCVSG